MTNKENFFLKDNTNVHTTYTNKFRFLLTIVPHDIFCICINAFRDFVFSAAINICLIDNYTRTSRVLRWPDALSILIQRRPRCIWFLRFTMLIERTMIHRKITFMSVKFKPLHLLVFFGDWHCWFALDWIQLLEKNLAIVRLFRMHPRSWWKMLEPHSNGDLEGIRRVDGVCCMGFLRAINQIDHLNQPQSLQCGFFLSKIVMLCFVSEVRECFLKTRISKKTAVYWKTPQEWYHTNESFAEGGTDVMAELRNNRVYAWNLFFQDHSVHIILGKRRWWNGFDNIWRAACTRTTWKNCGRSFANTKLKLTKSLPVAGGGTIGVLRFSAAGQTFEVWERWRFYCKSGAKLLCWG